MLVRNKICLKEILSASAASLEIYHDLRLSLIVLAITLRVFALCLRGCFHCITSCNRVCAQVLRMSKSCSQHIGGLRGLLDHMKEI